MPVPFSSSAESAAWPLRHRMRKWLSRIVELEAGEATALVCSFGFFLSVLAAYYIIRPVRDEMGVMLGQPSLQWLFLVTFLVMLAAVPVFGTIVAKVPRRLVVPVVYGFFIINLLGFWLVLESGGQTRAVAQIFFIWVSVFNLFIVSLFWSVMSVLWRSEQAKRLYGFIAAGGSVGALTGPVIAQSLVKSIGTDNLLLIAAGFLGTALLLATILRAHATGPEQEGIAMGERAETLDRGILAGALLAWRSPYMFRIALWVLLANLIVTYFYLEQARILGAAIADRAERVQLLARIDLAVGVATILMQVLLTGRILKMFGVGPATACVPAVAIAGFIGLAVAPGLGMIVAIMVAERSLGFAFANPAARVLWTVVEPEEKYKVQNFVDTVVFRGGDAASGWVFGSLLKGLGLGGAAIALVTVPFAVAWLVLSLVLARMHAERSRGRERAAAWDS